MKKILISVIVVMMLFTLTQTGITAEDTQSDTAVVVRGDTKITIGGEIRFRGAYRHNTADQVNDGSSYYTKLNIVGYTAGTATPYNVTNIYGTNYSGTATNGSYTLGSGSLSSGDDHQAFYDTRVRLSVDIKVSDSVHGFIELESNQGDTDTTDTVRWGTSSAATGIAAVGNSKSGDLRLRQAWLQYARDNYGVKIGHQLVKLGNGLFLDHSKFGDDAILAFIKPAREMLLAATTIKFKEGTINNPDDATAYAIVGAYTGNRYNISGDITFIDDQSFSSTTNYKAHVWNIGLRADGTWMVGSKDSLTARGDIELQAGDVKWNTVNMEDSAIRGWALLAGLDYKIDKNIKLTLEYAYGSGNADDDSSSNVNNFITSLGADQHYTYVYEYHVPTACGGLTGSGLCNTMYLKGGVAADITPSLYGELYVYWLRAAKNINIYNGDMSSNLGWEIDSKLSYKITKNLQYWIEGGYMFTGNAYDRIKTQTYTYTYLSTNPAVTYENTRNNAYAIRHGIQLNF
ncbi:MAG: hypothetical protein H7844_04165 [Nitrospirae bacterium YQR-1]